jgi:anthranilate synthase/aminodeoxychorismate synthase-like glutamine amidotransferase
VAVDRPDPPAAYAQARAAGVRPALLESLGPPTPFSRRSLLGLAPRRTLEVWDGSLYDDGHQVGPATDLLEELESGLRPGRDFPVWIGFFSYEFAGRLGLPANPPMTGLPEAAFCLYDGGRLWCDGREVAGAGARPVGVAPPPRAAPAPLSPWLPRVGVTSDYARDDYMTGVLAVQERIRAGWVYQVNLSHRFSFAAGDLDPLAYYARLRDANPSPFMGIVEGPGWAVVSGSPERLFERHGDTLSARPIAGTRPRGATAAADAAFEAELRGSIKELAEHVMLVDLLRNDLSRVCRPGTVEVSEAFTVERYSHVMHLVSEVRGRSRAAVGDLVRAIFPGGTITGAPKESVMREIARLEPVPRGAYTGSLGYVSGRRCDFNILIRSLTVAEGRGHISAGGGTVIGSDPASEYDETRHKAEALLHVLGGGRAGRAPAAPVRDHSWRPPRPRLRIPARVVFVECHDSFSHTIVDYLRVLGATVDVVDHARGPADALSAGATHLVLGPGPGDPASSGRLLAWVEAGLARRLPLLGVCLGHQALGVALGARLARAERPVHGEAHAVHHDGEGLFRGLPAPAPFTRYHSLCLCDLPPRLRRTAWTNDGLVMAIAHATLPACGVQFHPESMLSPAGLDLLANFLQSGTGPTE